MKLLHHHIFEYMILLILCTMCERFMLVSFLHQNTESVFCISYFI